MAAVDGTSRSAEPRRAQRRQPLDCLDVERSSLHRALDEGRYQSVVYQVRLGMDPNVRSRQGLTPLMRCARLRPAATSQQLVRALLERGANPDLTDARGNNLLQLAVKEGNLALVRLLLTENNVNFHHRDADGNTALHLLASQSADLCRMVLRSAHRFHIDCDVGNADGLTPLMAACRAGNLPVVELLATLGGASFTKRDFQHRRTAQDWLCASVGPGGLAMKLEQLLGSRGQSAQAAGQEDPYERLRQSRRVETLTRLFQQSQRQPQGQEAAEAAEATEAAQPGTAAAAEAARSVSSASSAAGGDGGGDSSSIGSQLLLLRRSRTSAGGHSRLLCGIFDAYEQHLSASYRRPAVPMPGEAGGGGGSGAEDSRSGSRPVSRISSGVGGGRSQRSPVGLTRRMTEVASAGLRLKQQRIRSAARRSDGSADAAAAANLLLNTSQDSGGLRRLSSRL